MMVSGNLILRCAVYSERHEDARHQPTIPQTTHKILDTQVGGKSLLHRGVAKSKVVWPLLFLTSIATYWDTALLTFDTTSIQ